jgi:dihydropyrimidine dehydrogenase (NAD+) subunit PreA
VRPLPHRLRGHLAPGDHASERDGVRMFEVVDEECVGCNLCMHVCPVDDCITMERVDDGSYRNWTTHPNNPMAEKA